MIYWNTVFTHRWIATTTQPCLPTASPRRSFLSSLTVATPLSPSMTSPILSSILTNTIQTSHPHRHHHRHHPPSHPQCLPFPFSPSKFWQDSPSVNSTLCMLLVQTGDPITATTSIDLTSNNKSNQTSWSPWQIRLSWRSSMTFVIIWNLFPEQLVARQILEDPRPPSFSSSSLLSKFSSHSVSSAKRERES